MPVRLGERERRRLIHQKPKAKRMTRQESAMGCLRMRRRRGKGRSEAWRGVRQAPGEGDKGPSEDDGGDEESEANGEQSAADEDRAQHFVDGPRCVVVERRVAVLERA